MGWRLVFRAGYRLLRILDPLIRLAWRRRAPLLRRIVDLQVVGRRSRRRRGTLVTLLTVNGAWHVGHPNGPTAWTDNLLAAGEAEVVAGDGLRRRVSAIPMHGGPEREAVIRATWSQQPFPANVLYALARRHVRTVGVYFRLISIDDR